VVGYQGLEPRTR